MSVGNNVPQMGYNAVLGLAKETTFGTFVTSTVFVEFNSESLKHSVENIKLETINGTRDYKKILRGNTTVDGSIEAPFNIASDAVVLMFKQAMGGTCTAVAASSTSYTHTLRTGDMENNKSSAGAAEFKSLSFAVRPGDSGTNTWNFFGCRVNSFTLKAEVGQPVAMTAEIIGKGCSTSSTIPTAAYSDVNPVMFVGASIQTGATTTALAAEYVKSFELSLNNNISGDHRILGSREVAQLPPVKRDVTLKVTQVFDTTTAYDRYTQATSTTFELTLDSQVALGASSGTYRCVITLPKCILAPNTPSVSGPGPITQELEYTCLYASTQSYAIQATVRNLTASYD